MTHTPFTVALNIQRQVLEQATDTLQKTSLLPERLETLASVDVGC
ncbi:hypothetical protein SAMN04487948_11710 [Halogranum amylolyticum]|uniref:Uncharacterized protein n=1 Tax=Halogranum amylolyticum TaxID=660520 RepID=A0A1H8VJ07_9EURY|nr:hypothetical protein SAMN04487948_11710 [Halogranum amylolyticum]